MEKALELREQKRKLKRQKDEWTLNVDQFAEQSKFFTIIYTRRITGVNIRISHRHIDLGIITTIGIFSFILNQSE